MKTIVSPITGEQKPPGLFRVEEFDSFDADSVADVLDGTKLGVIFRHFSPTKERQAICSNFWQYEHRYIRGSDAPAHYAGAYHYGKPLEAYFAEAATANEQLPAIFRNVSNPIERFRQALALTLVRRSRRLRAASWAGKEACQFVMRSWANQGSFALNPHEDEAQCNDPTQAGFEIQDAAREKPVAAVNLCLENGGGGRLRIWNLRPDLESKTRLGLNHTGSPYPVDLLTGVPYVDVVIQAGDLYVFDGRFIHAVTRLENSQETSHRATIAHLMAHLGSSETIWWS